MKFLYNAPAILHRGALIIGDTHFGIEERLRRQGIFSDDFSEQVFLRIKALLAETKAKRLIILGDVKENITTVDARTQEMLSRLRLLAEVIIVKGNHDGGIEATGVRVIGPEGFVHQGLGLCHGHSWPAEGLMQCRYIVCAHQHPLVSFVDRAGKRHGEPAWVVAKPDAELLRKRYEKFNPEIEMVLLPAFNPLVGSPINSTAKIHLGPLLGNKLFKSDDALVFCLDGTSLGRLKELGHSGYDSYGKQKKRARPA